MLRKINSLIEVCLRHPFEGTGKPEPLKGDLAGFWSRRIDREHRLVYRVTKEAIEIAQGRYPLLTGQRRRPCTRPPRKVMPSAKFSPPDVPRPAEARERLHHVRVTHRPLDGAARSPVEFGAGLRLRAVSVSTRIAAARGVESRIRGDGPASPDFRAFPRDGLAPLLHRRAFADRPRDLIPLLHMRNVSPARAANKESPTIEQGRQDPAAQSVRGDRERAWQVPPPGGCAGSDNRGDGGANRPGDRPAGGRDRGRREPRGLARPHRV